MNTTCLTLLLASLMVVASGAVPGGAAATPASAVPAVQRTFDGVTRGHVQVGLAVFDRSGTLASESDERGLSPYGGPTLRLGFVHYLASLPWLGFGAGVRGTFGNSSKGDQEYFFNPIFTSAILGLNIPAGPHGSAFELHGDLGFTNILAKSTRVTEQGTTIFHEYGIGLGVGLLVGYRLELPAIGTGLTLSLQHSRHWVGVDVDRAAGKTWALGVTSLLAGASW